ncbi:hypothetical protein SNE40_000380 [Patella caerulea]|uniref:DUF985 domain-containing protein n=1 Tax=Patella caerulea TaxID=87958 RepID=A0AAN8KL53_PATCE
MSAEQMEKLKKILQLEQHPEGNQFRQVWRGDREMNFVNKTLHDGPRSVGSSIHTLLTSPDFVSWHRVLSDEIYFWHAGGVMKVHLLDDKGNHSHVLLGDVLKNDSYVYQVLIPHDMWYAAEIVEGDYLLFSAVVIPGFEFRDWTAAKREEMIKEYPQHTDLITRLTKQ